MLCWISGTELFILVSQGMLIYVCTSSQELIWLCKDNKNIIWGLFKSWIMLWAFGRFDMPNYSTYLSEQFYTYVRTMTFFPVNSKLKFDFFLCTSIMDADTKMEFKTQIYVSILDQEPLKSIHYIHEKLNEYYAHTHVCTLWNHLNSWTKSSVDSGHLLTTSVI
jgi:hypothetical protein